jgi:long-chain acyl-CoA synthetase
MANALRARFRAEEIGKGDAAIIWAESRPGWVAALWACLMDGIIVVPVDPQSSESFVQKIAAKAQPKLVLTGDRVAALANAWRLSEIEQASAEAPAGNAALDLDDVAEIVFTSGTTAEPKGVVITHRNLLANLEPVAREVDKYRKYAGPFLPLRILNLLPLSHLFGQSLALLIPPLIPTSVVFLSTTAAQEIVRQVHARRISAIVAVPKILEVLRDYAARRFPEVDDPRLDRGKWPVRWWHYRRIHRAFGWKFWAFISGGAPLAADLEKFWQHLGYVVIQGYGLTETAPIVTLSHPFHVREGTVGKPLAGVNIKIADDGEILVRGENVTRGYFAGPGETTPAFEGEWFHTGDVGELDTDGHLQIRGRKKEMIVTPEGLKIFPQDVEKVLDRIPGVRESAVIGTDRVHAVLALEPGTSADDVVREANQRLEEHQKIRQVSIWPGTELPRTASTRKLKRAEIVKTIASGAPPPKSENPLAAVIEKYAPGRTITPETTLDELGLSSLDRVQLMLELEQKLDTEVDERAFASVRTIADLAKPVAAESEPIPFPRYSRGRIARAVRRLSLPYFLLPLTRIFAHIRVSGREHLNEIHGPAIFASNHQSHFDLPVILAALPSKWRYRLATAMSKDFFDPHFFPSRHKRGEVWLNSLYYRLATFVFNAFPIPQRQAGAGQTIRYMGELAENGWSILIFPEGDRTETGEIEPFQPGVGMIASHLGLPVVPVRIVGLDKVLHRRWKWPRPGRVELKFGAPLQLSGGDFSELAARVEEAVREL